jgi:RNA polymerase sigma-70 factor (ECF subfamily)
LKDSGELEVLLISVGSGDRQAFARLYDVQAPRLFAIALRIARNVDAAEDIVQDAFVSVWKNAARYDPAKGNAASWLAAIVRNRAIDHVRFTASAAQRSVPLDASIPDTAANLAENAIFSPRMGTKLANCLETLREEHRKSVLLAYCYGLTHEELAQSLRQPLGTVKSWLRRSLLRLKDCLER